LCPPLHPAFLLKMLIYNYTTLLSKKHDFLKKKAKKVKFFSRRRKKGVKTAAGAEYPGQCREFPPAH
jgi:hypothetical protein